MSAFLVEEAKQFAEECHVGQRYSDDKPYTYHLQAVVNVLNDFRNEIEVFTASDDHERFDRLLAAGWLHDVIEDTPVTMPHIQVRFGHSVANLVWACTGVGTNRKERNAEIYRKIGMYPIAAVVKLADSIANVEESGPGSRHRSMYVNELPEFEAVIRPHVPSPMWARLERALAAQ